MPIRAIHHGRRFALGPLPAGLLVLAVTGACGTGGAPASGQPSESRAPASAATVAPGGASASAATTAGPAGIASAPASSATAPGISPSPAARTSAQPAAESPGPSAATSGRGGAGGSGSVCEVASTADVRAIAAAASAEVLVDTGSVSDVGACVWQLGPSGTAMIQVWIGPSAVVEEGTWAQFQAKPGVSGVGAEAHWDVSANWLLVKIGAGYALFSVVGASVTDPAAASTSLAGLVIPKLGG